MSMLKFFKRLVKDHICSTFPSSLHPLQFTYQPKRSTRDAIAQVLHTTLSHLDREGNYVRFLLISYSSAFNTIVPEKLSVLLMHHRNPTGSPPPVWSGSDHWLPPLGNLTLSAINGNLLTCPLILNTKSQVLAPLREI
ncbi:hypothetical protein LDENG_00223630 [Lucifuga dentata]|nr:hypothetical protein LDENG_00223630 [Lucifuga dentata]